MGACCTKEDLEMGESDVTGRKNTKMSTKRKPKKTGAGISPEVVNEVFEEKEFNNDKEETLWDESTTVEADEITDEQYFDKDYVTLERKGVTMPLFKDIITAKIRENLRATVKEVYEKIGQFNYRRAELDSCGFENSNLEVQPVTQCENGMYYIGQWNKTNNTREGRGIAIYADGSIYEGFWKHDSRNGAGRMIYSNGDVYQGEWTEDS